MTDTCPTPPHGWTCFHCGEHFPPTFLGQRDAKVHFGTKPDCEPGCAQKTSRQEWYWLTQLRIAEDEVRQVRHDLNNENTEARRAMARMESEHRTALTREEEKGYARGLEDARKYPDTLGLARIAS